MFCTCFISVARPLLERTKPSLSSLGLTCLSNGGLPPKRPRARHSPPSPRTRGNPPVGASAPPGARRGAKCLSRSRLEAAPLSPRPEPDESLLSPPRSSSLDCAPLLPADMLFSLTSILFLCPTLVASFHASLLLGPPGLSMRHKAALGSDRVASRLSAASVAMCSAARVGDGHGEQDCHSAKQGKDPVGVHGVGAAKTQLPALLNGSVAPKQTVPDHGSVLDGSSLTDTLPAKAAQSKSHTVATTSSLAGRAGSIGRGWRPSSASCTI
jgi:hypothetical protein